MPTLNTAELGLGIDTGGTFTDAAAVNAVTAEVVAAGKAPTTRHDLAEGIVNAVRQIPADVLARVGLVSISTTLATNAIVEGEGAPICLLLIGHDRELFRTYDLHRRLPTANLAFVAGGHNGVGMEREPLDEDEIRRIAREEGRRVSAFAVSGYFGVRNADHELRARQILVEETGLPVTCGHELATELDSVLRAATCALNASLVPLLRDLMESLRKALKALGVDAPAMVVRGDGSLMRMEMALERPVETILSGPAASVVGAQALAKLDDMLVVDVGGTTTDLATVREGMPRLNRRGASVGRWRTLVRAVQTASSGLGGDSQVTLDESARLHVGPQRAVPVAYAAHVHPSVRDALGEALSRVARLEPRDLVMYLIARPPKGMQLTHVEERILEGLRDGPQPLWRLATRDPWVHFYLSNRNRLETTGILARCAFTPTDALHLLGRFQDWDTEASSLAARLLAWYTQTSAAEVADQVMLLVQHSLVRTMANMLANGFEDPADSADGRLMELALNRNGSDLEVQLHSHLPIVGLGAPADHFIAPAAAAMHGSAVLPKYHAVANAVGAICGSVVIRETLGVQPVYRSSGLEAYVVTGPFASVRHADRESAVEDARRRARDLASEGAARAGAADIEVKVEVVDDEATPGPGYGDRLYLGSSVTATAIGRPRFASEAEEVSEEEALW